MLCHLLGRGAASAGPDGLFPGLRVVILVLAIVQLACASPETLEVDHPVQDSFTLNPGLVMGDTNRGPMVRAEASILADSGGRVWRALTLGSGIGTLFIANGADGIWALPDGGEAADAIRAVSVSRTVALVRSRDTVAVVGADGRIVSYRLDIGTGRLTWQDELSTGLSVGDGCAVAGRLFLHGARQGTEGVIHEVSGGTVVKSFGLPYRVDSPLLRELLNSGRLVCAEEPPMIVLALERFPFLVSYSVRGDVLWSSQVPGFHVGLARQRGNSLLSGLLGDSLSVGITLALAEGILLYQSMTLSRDDIARYNAGNIRTFTVDQGSGQLTFLGSIRGRLVGGDGRTVIGYMHGISGPIMRYVVGVQN